MRPCILRSCGESRRGFTLIELLVVVAIIALLISILLPSLGQARAQSRTTLCGTRITQVAKAMIMYADDYAETPPFLDMGQSDWDEALPGSTKKDKSGVDFVTNWAKWENWLMPDMPTLWAANQGGIISAPEQEVEARGLIQRGTLFPYVRFDSLYRCPDFERKPRGGPHAQRLFNYTRSWAGRKALSKLLNDVDDFNGQPVDDWIRAGKIVKISQAYAPSGYWMMIDEQYDRHVGGAMDDFDPPNPGPGGIVGSMAGMPMCADVVHTIIGDEFGQYHGSKGRVFQTAAASTQIPMVEQASIAFYDGHVSLYRDPLPGRKAEGDLGGFMTEINFIVDMVKGMVFSQRGVDPGNVSLPI